MINKDRIVPVTATDLITLYGLILKVGSVNVTALNAKSAAGDFELEEAGTVLCSEPVKSFDIASGVSTASVYFVPAYDFAGFSINGVDSEVEGIDADGRTLYLASLSGGTITAAKVGF